MIDYPQLQVLTRTEWRAWLADYHSSAQGVWLVTWKKVTGKPRPSYDDIVEEALCVGWVDSLPRRLDAERSQLLVTPRKPRSNWSLANQQRVERLTASGLMLPAGLAVVARAKADGSWNALDQVETLTEPPDLLSALNAEPVAYAVWDEFPPSTRRAILEWISNAKTTGTRQKRIAQTVSEAAVGRRANQWRQPNSVK
ncbi:MAG: YdeI/OmpD-associated family protein [Kineosporiaceae bacterium]